MRIWVSPLLVAVLWFSCTVRADIWETDYSEALETAREEGRFVLLNFTGSDWCGWCMKLEDAVFSEREFRNYAEDNLVCVFVDFPQGKRLSRKVRKQNSELKREFGVRGFPTIVLLSPQGEKIGRTGYREGGAEAYVKHLEGMIKPHRGNVAAPNTVQGPEKAQLRLWTDARNRKVRGMLVGLSETEATIQAKNGREITIGRDKLVWWDQNYLNAWQREHGLMDSGDGGRERADDS